MAITVLRVDGNVVSGNSQTIINNAGVDVDTGVIYNGMAIDTGGIATFNEADIGGDAFIADSLHNNTEALGPNTSISVGGTALAVTSGAKTFTQNTTGTPNGAGYAVLDVSGLDQVTPFREAVRNSYNAVAPGALNYSVDAGGLVVLLASTNINSNDIAGMLALGWTQAGTSKAISNITDVVTYYRIASADEPSASIAPLMTSNSGRGFSILWVYNAGNTAPVGVTIDSVDADDSIEIDQTGIVILGSNYEVASAEVIISPSDNINDVSAVNLTPTAWADDSITANMPVNLQMLYGTNYYIFVRTDSGEVNASGKPVELIPPSGNTYLIIENQNDLGVLLDVTGLEFGTDQLEYQTTSLNGGTVHIGFSGVVYVYGYPGSAPVTDEIYIRLGDASDQTWSNSTTDTIIIGTNATPVSLNNAVSTSLGVSSALDITAPSQLSVNESVASGINLPNIIITRSLLNVASVSSASIAVSLALSTTIVLSSFDAVSAGVHSSQTVSLDAVLNNSESTSLGVSSSNLIKTKTSLGTAESTSVGISNALDLSSDSSLSNVDAVSSGNYSSTNLKVVSKLSDQGSISSGISFVSDISIGGSLSDASSISLGINTHQLINTRAILQNSDQSSAGVFDSQAAGNKLSLLNASSVSLGVFSANGLNTHSLLQSSSGISLGINSSLALGGGLVLNAVEATSSGLSSSINLSTSALLGDSESYSSGIFYEGIITTNPQLEIFSSIGQSVNSASAVTTKTNLSDVQSLALGIYLVGELVYLSPNSFLSSTSKSKELSSVSKTIYFT
ncbi:MAG: hypothetical protein COA86_02855 [Kangiella sp.]|nr:MAG: hypothetical protein COA86_02855 [Kangiella sp.]